MSKRPIEVDEATTNALAFVLQEARQEIEAHEAQRRAFAAAGDAPYPPPPPVATEEEALAQAVRIGVRAMAQHALRGHEAGDRVLHGGLGCVRGHCHQPHAHGEPYAVPLAPGAGAVDPS
jgi:hypothetical protein